MRLGIWRAFVRVIAGGDELKARMCTFASAFLYMYIHPID